MMPTRVLAALAVAVALVAPMFPVLQAHAQTYEQCMAGCGDRARACGGVGDGRDCSSERSSCTAECSGYSRGGPPRPPKYGAFAYSLSTKRYGFSYDAGNRANAEATALRACQSAARDCKVVLWFYNTCGSIATTPDGTFGTGYGAAKYLAEGYALQGCRQQGGKTCTVQRTICTGM